ncbi:mitochondrial triosephosphate isomerase [Astrocystis sublimbata]|nr:mitochondrial triosephosphate isomerase [Astrocystis sublimbata]
MSPPTSSRRRLIGVSTKMYFSFARTTSYITTLIDLLSSFPTSVRSTLQNTDIFVVPDHISLTSVISQLQDSAVPIQVGAQDAFSEDVGAFTGEISPSVLSEIGVRIVELGHAERRALFSETDTSTAQKAAAAVRNGMVPLVCIGEKTKPESLTTTIHESGNGNGNGAENESKINAEAAVASALPFIQSQIVAVLSAIPDTAEVILAYEPVWAIGAAEPASSSYVVAVAQAIRNLECVRRREQQPQQGSGLTRILYGGSAGPGLFEKLTDGGVDGLFLGRFAHDPDMFVKTILEVATAAAS